MIWEPSHAVSVATVVVVIVIVMLNSKLKGFATRLDFAVDTFGVYGVYGK